jgi:general secretion pathway protein A
MYKTFFHLTRRPFEISPDPTMFYATPQHQEALAGLFYGIKAGKGFMVLTGEVGTGKTLVVRCLQELLDQKRVTYAFVFNPCLSSLDFLSYVAKDLGLSPCPTAKGELLLSLSRLLIERHRQGITAVLVVEEAQHLTPVVLEEIRLLTNLESPKGKLLQILLVGQPELVEKIASPDLRQLRQRITLWFRLAVLSEEETSNYVRYRLKLAGDKSGEIFTSAALERVYRYSQGTPRLINTLCDNAMLSAATLRQDLVMPELIDEAAAALGMTPAGANGQKTTHGIPWQVVEEIQEKLSTFPGIAETVHTETSSPPKEEAL